MKKLKVRFKAAEAAERDFRDMEDQVIPLRELLKAVLATKDVSATDEDQDAHDEL